MIVQVRMPILKVTIDECEKFARDLEKKSSTQLKKITIIVFIGIVLFSTFPFLNAGFDNIASRIFETMLSEEESRTLLRNLTNDQTTRHDEKKHANAELSKHSQNLHVLNNRAIELASMTDEHKEIRFAKWRQEYSHLDADHTNRDIAVTDSRTVIVVGSTGSGRDVRPRIVRRVSSGSWSTVGIPISEDVGELHSATVTTNGDIVVVGWKLSSSGNRETAILWSTRDNDGKTWQTAASISISESEEYPSCELRAVTHDANSNLYAVGVCSAADYRYRREIVLTSSDGDMWRESTKCDTGGVALYAIVATPNGRVYAAGSIQANRDERKYWPYFAEYEINNQTCRVGPDLTHQGEGTLWTVEFFSGTNILAAGTSRQELGLRKLMILSLSEYEGNWNATNLTQTEPYDSIAGELHGSMKFFDSDRSQQGIAFVGNDGTPTTPKILVVSVLEHEMSLKVVRPSAPDGKHIGGRLYDIARNESNSFVAAGKQLWLIEEKLENVGPIDDELYATGNAKILNVPLWHGLENILADMEDGGGEIGYAEAIVDWIKEAKMEIEKWKLERELYEKSHANSMKAKEDFNAADRDLESAKILIKKLDISLVQADKIRVIGRVSIQFILIILLFYFLKVNVDHYRHLRHSAKFYRSRAQAIRLFSPSPESTEAEIDQEQVWRFVEIFYDNSDMAWGEKTDKEKATVPMNEILNMVKNVNNSK